MAYIDLSGKRGKGKRTLVDQDIADRYAHLSWFLSDTGYAMRRSDFRDDGTKMTVRLHRLITEAPEGMVVDHKNGDRLDNRRSNLRVVTQTENAKNHHGTIGYTWDASKKKWMVRYRNKFHGRYTTEDEAKEAFKRARSGVPYLKQQRSQYMLPRNIHKQFGKYNVKFQRAGILRRKNGLATLAEAEQILAKWQKEG